VMSIVPAIFGVVGACISVLVPIEARTVSTQTGQYKKVWLTTSSRRESILEQQFLLKTH